MSAAVQTPAELPPLPMRAGHLLLSELIDLYMGRYEGRDVSRVHRAAWWRRQLGHIALQDLGEDQVHASLEGLAESRGRYYAGKDAEGRPIFKARAGKVSPATVNRHAAALAAVITWAIKRRIAPAGYVHPCRTIERRTEDNERTRFLSDDERQRLLTACRAARWPRMYGLVMMFLTTGARRGELMGLTWADIDFDRAEATVARTKNGTPRILPLVPAVAAELQKFKGAPRARVFASPRDPDKPFAFDGQFRQALKVAKVKDFTPHCLRHTCASMLAMNGASLLEVADALGHKQLQVTKRYAHLATSHKASLMGRVFGEIV